MFVAIKGYEKDGHDFIDEAISGGASNILVDYNYKDTKQLLCLNLRMLEKH